MSQLFFSNSLPYQRTDQRLLRLYLIELGGDWVPPKLATFAVLSFRSEHKRTHISPFLRCRFLHNRCTYNLKLLYQFWNSSLFRVELVKWCRARILRPRYSLLEKSWHVLRRLLLFISYYERRLIVSAFALFPISLTTISCYTNRTILLFYVLASITFGLTSGLKIPR